MTFPNTRSWFAYALFAALIGATAWAFSFPNTPPADFTFVNNTEIKSIDPAIVTGHPEGRVIQGLFEGVVGVHPKTLEPIPAIAEGWDISEDRLHYTFRIRKNARWSDGTPITAHDIVWSLRRLLDPATAGQYSFQLWYAKNAKRYSTMDLKEGDPVEVELNELPDDARPFARGKLLHGTLKGIEKLPDGNGGDQKRYTVSIGGVDHVYLPGSEGKEACKQVLLDFREVGVRAEDEHTLKIELNDPTPYFLSLMAFYPLFPVQAKCVETYGPMNWMKPENLVCSGPFTLQSRRIRDRIRLKKSETYWDRENVKCRTVDVLAIESVVTGLNLYLTGEADWMTSIPTPIIPILRAQKRDDYFPEPELTVYFYRFNCTKAPFNDVRVRRAFAMAINKQQVVDTVTRAGELPARSFVPPGMTGYEPQLGPDYDPTEAKRLLAEAGFPDGKGMRSITLLYDTGEANQSIAELIQDQWKRTLGIQVTPYNQPWSTIQASQRTLDYTVCRSGWVGDYMDPNTFLDMFVTGGANNETGWGNPEYDRLIKAAGSEFDPKKRMKLLQDAEAILVDEVPIVPIYFRVNKNMFRPYVKGFYNNPLDTHPLKFIDVDVAARERFLEEERKETRYKIPSEAALLKQEGAGR
jgi:oligopeptide transport system substrate-binding protein